MIKQVRLLEVWVMINLSWGVGNKWVEVAQQRIGAETVVAVPQTQPPLTLPDFRSKTCKTPSNYCSTVNSKNDLIHCTLPLYTKCVDSEDLRWPKPWASH